MQDAFEMCKDGFIVGRCEKSRNRGFNKCLALPRIPMCIFSGGVIPMAVRISEIANEIFQAAGRGAVRRSVNGDVPDGCNLWIVYSSLGPGV